MAALGTGVPLAGAPRVLGVTKAYATRVGAGPLPTELHGPEGALPPQALAFVHRVEQLAGVPVQWVSTGAERGDVVRRAASTIYYS